jgi:hypothetical protein
MDHLQLAMMVMATTDTPWGPRDAHRHRRQLTAEELDALADWGWHRGDVKGRLAAGAIAMLSRLRPRASNRINSTPLPSAEAMAHL